MRKSIRVLMASPLVIKLLNTSRKAVSMEPMPATLGRALERKSIRLVSSCTCQKLSPQESPMNRMQNHGRVNIRNSLRVCTARMRAQRPLSASRRRLSAARVSSCSSHFSRRVCHGSVLGRKPMAQRASRCTSGETQSSTSVTMTSATTQ